MKISGKPKNVSREFIRSWASASACVLSHHGYFVDVKTLAVKVCDLSNLDFDCKTKATGRKAGSGLDRWNI